MGIEKIDNESSKKTEATLPFLEEYESSIHKVLDFPKQGTEKTGKRNKYELEMISRLAYDYEQLEEINQEDFKTTIEELLKGSWDHSDIKKRRKQFLEDRKEELPYTFEYQNNSYTKFHLPKKSSLQAFYDHYLKSEDDSEEYDLQEEKPDYDNYD